MVYHFTHNVIDKKWYLVVNDSTMMNQITNNHKQYAFQTYEEMLIVIKNLIQDEVNV